MKNPLGQKVQVVIDRPLGSHHPRYFDLIYPINYGYIPGILGGDGQEQDCYVLGVNIPLTKFEGWVVAIIHRLDDIEEKWVVMPEGMKMSALEIMEQVSFQEKYFQSFISKILEDKK